MIASDLLPETGLEKAPSTAVIGIGNILFNDEGLGIYATEFLKQNYDFSPTIELIDGGTLGMNMIHYYQSYDRVLLLDTISVENDAHAGAIYNVDAQVLQGLGSSRKTAHEVEVLQTLELGALAGNMADIKIIAMVPEEMDSVIMALTATVQQAMPLFIQTILAELQKWGIQAVPQHEITPLMFIIDQYNQQRATDCA
jgi:hydrogenase maturation protease